MVDWEVTATTIYCDAVDDEVTVMIYRDGTAKCTGQKKYATPDKETVRAMKRKSKQPGQANRLPRRWMPPGKAIPG